MECDLSDLSRSFGFEGLSWLVVPNGGGMRTVILLRHARAANPSGTPDEHRPLSPGGEQDAQRVSAAIAAQVAALPEARTDARTEAADLLLSSSALRARQTAEAVRAAQPGPPPLWVEPSLYLAPADALLTRLQELDDACVTVVLVGHNPGLQQLAVDLCAAEVDRARLTGRFGPGTYAVVAAPVDRWADLRSQEASLAALHHP
jgi:phosphohistidine phosphatase